MHAHSNKREPLRQHKTYFDLGKIGEQLVTCKYYWDRDDDPGPFAQITKVYLGQEDITARIGCHDMADLSRQIEEELA